jgi:Putative zinc-finger
MSCEAIRELFSARIDAALSADERARLDAHLASCAECAREWVRFEGAVALLRAVEPAHAPAGFVDRVLAARPRPWYWRLGRALLVPWPVKLPLEATAIVLVAGLALLVFQRSPELQRAALTADRPAPTADRAEAPSPSSGAPPPPAERDPAFQGVEPRAVAPAPPTPAPAVSEHAPTTGVPPTSPSPSATALKKEEFALRDEAKRQAPSETRRRAADETQPRVAGEVEQRPTAAAKPPVPATPEDVRKEAAARETRPSAEPPAAADARAKSSEALRPFGRRDAEPERAAGLRQAAPPEPSSRVQTLAARPIDVEARLTVAERGTAERTVTELVARAGGHVVSRTDDGAATVLALTVPTERWDEVRRELERVGPLRIDRSAPRTGQLRVVLRLEP